MADSAACFTLISPGVLSSTNETPAPLSELKSALESPNDSVKIETMKRILVMMVNGEPLPGLLMHVIRFVMPSKSKPLKKLLLVYWEVCPKYNGDKLKQEMILVCNAVRNDLQHPNEFVKGSTLRFLTKLHDPELLEPLVPAVRSALLHKHPYVRKNAILAIMAIFKTHEFLVPDAADLVFALLQKEAEPTVRRNAFWMLAEMAPEKASTWFDANLSQIITASEDMQLCALEMIKKGSGDRAKHVQLIFELLQSPAPAVKYEAANALVSLTSHSTAIKAAAQAYIDLILKSSDNNVKLIVLDRLNDLKEKHGDDGVIEEIVMDIIRVLASPDIAVRRKCLSIAIDLVNSRNVEEAIGFLKKELMKTLEDDYEKNTEYRKLLIQSIHTCAIKFPSIAIEIIHTLLDFLSESSSASAIDVIAFVREVITKFPQLRSEVVQRLVTSMRDIKTGRVFRGVLWLTGEFCIHVKEIEDAFKTIREVLGEVPILASEQRALDELNAGSNPPSEDSHSVAVGSKLNGLKSPTSATAPAGSKVLADGTYATQSALSHKSTSLTRLENIKGQVKPPLRQLILTGDFYLGSVLASTLTKLCLRLEELGEGPRVLNASKTEAMLIMTSIIRVGKSDIPATRLDEDSHDRIVSCLRVLSSAGREHHEALKSIFLEKCRDVYVELSKTEKPKTEQEKKKAIKPVPQCDDIISFAILKPKRALNEISNPDLVDLTRATGGFEKSDDLISKLSRVVQLTGFSDPVYAEAYVMVHQYDVLLDVLIVNQTNETLQNMSLEFSTLGDLKLVERPTPVTLPPRGFISIKSTIKVSSTETGIIFGNIVYDGTHVNDTKCITLHDVHVDILDYIRPTVCSELEFRSMWTEFEWENKVNVVTNITDLRQYLAHVMKVTNMACLTPDHALSGDCGFLAANMSAKSIFGEDALANISLEKQGEASIMGHIRIRSKTQGIALSLGDKITTSQKAGIAAA